MAKQIRYRYTVIGVGNFPLDMLRHDRAWPSCEEDSSYISSTFRRYSGEALSRPITPALIHLTSLNEPTVGRWSSFSWSVSNVEKMVF